MGLIQDIANLAPSAEKPVARSTQTYHLRSAYSGRQFQRTNGHRLDVGRWLADRQVEFRTKAVDGGTAFLVPCPFDPNHGGNGETAVYPGRFGTCRPSAASTTVARAQVGRLPRRPWQARSDHYDPPLGRQEPHPASRHGDHHGRRQRPGAAGSPAVRQHDQLPPNCWPWTCGRRSRSSTCWWRASRALSAGDPRHLRHQRQSTWRCPWGPARRSCGHWDASDAELAYGPESPEPATIRETAQPIAKAKRVELAEHPISCGLRLAKAVPVGPPGPVRRDDHPARHQGGRG